MYAIINKNGEMLWYTRDIEIAAHYLNAYSVVSCEITHEEETIGETMYETETLNGVVIAERHRGTGQGCFWSRWAEYVEELV